MKKLLSALIIVPMLGTSALASPGHATPYTHGAKVGWRAVPKVAIVRQATGTSAAGMSVGAAMTGGFITSIGILVGYDIWRRMNCTDPWGLGGPGFDRPILPTDNVMVNPNCPKGRGR